MQCIELKYITCSVAGVSRSASVIAAWIIANEGIDVEEALERIM